MLTKFRARRKAKRAIRDRNRWIAFNGGCCWCKTEREWSEFYRLGTHALPEPARIEKFREAMPKVYFEQPRYQSNIDRAEQEVHTMLAQLRG